MHALDLHQVRRSIEDGLAKLLAEESNPQVLETCADENEYASRLSEHQLHLALAQRRAGRAQELARALERMLHGEWGVCEECGEDIAPARLMARPTATLCVACQALIEESRTAA